MKRISIFDENPDRSRYTFQFALCTVKDGWAQLDTTQDAPTTEIG